MVETIARISKKLRGHQPEGHLPPPVLRGWSARLKEVCDIPVFHDDQHGTAVVITAPTNALKVVGKKKEDVKIVQRHRGRRRPPPSCCQTWGTATSPCATRTASWSPAPRGSPATMSWPPRPIGRRTGTLADTLVGADNHYRGLPPRAGDGEMVEAMAMGP